MLVFSIIIWLTAAGATQPTTILSTATTTPPTETTTPVLATPAPVSPCFTIDGQTNDWQNLQPVIVDDAQPSIPRAADVRQVYAATCQGAFYLMIVVDGPAQADAGVLYLFEVDTNGDGTPEYQAGFDRTHPWLWNLKGTGYADQKNLSSPSNAKLAVGQVAELMVPLDLLDNATAPRIRVYTYIGDQVAKRRTVWAQVQPLEMIIPPTGTTTPALATATPVSTCFTIDGQMNDWQNLKPVIVDDAQPSIPRAADVRQVYAVTCQGALYLMIVTDGAANAGDDVGYAFFVDLNADAKSEYQPGFMRQRAWVWDLKGTGYADPKNMTSLTGKDYQVAIGQVVEFMLPLSFLDDVTSPRIRVYTGVGNQTANPNTTWAQVQPLEMIIPPTGTTPPVLATPTPIPPCFTIDGQMNDWQNLEPVIVDDAQPSIPRAADVRQVYAVTCRGALYLMIVTDGAANAGDDVTYAFVVDLNADAKPEYQPGFTRQRAWVWDLKGTGYADPKNMTSLTGKDYQVAIGQVVEFMLPLGFLDNVTSLRIRVYAAVGNQTANPPTIWAQVEPLMR